MSAPTSPSIKSDENVKSNAIGLFLRGLCMGAADVVPGVSGGTIAFITGIYPRFIDALRSLHPRFLGLAVKGQFPEAWAALMAMHWGLLIPLGLGVAVAIVTLSKLITGLMFDAPGPTYAFFFGLILASAWIPLAQIHRRDMTAASAVVCAAIFAWFFVGLQPEGSALVTAQKASQPQAIFYAGKVRHKADLDSIRVIRDANLDKLPITVFDPKGVLEKQKANLKGVTVYKQKSALYAWLEKKPALWVLGEERSTLPWVFLCGVLAISAMVLPGLSGSFLLLFLGEYHAVFGALHQSLNHVLVMLGKTPNPMAALVAHNQLSDFAYFGVFLVGIVFGLALFSRVVGFLFEKARDLTLALLTGLMLGALRLPGDIVIAEVESHGTTWGVVTAVVIVGGIMVVGLNLLDRRKDSPERVGSG